MIGKLYTAGKMVSNLRCTQSGAFTSLRGKRIAGGTASNLPKASGNKQSRPILKAR